MGEVSRCAAGSDSPRPTSSGGPFSRGHRGPFSSCHFHFYRDGEIADLLSAAQGLSGTTGLRPCTYATLLALLAVTGMRSSEPLRLNRDDVDLARGVLTVRKSKFGKSRYIPVHESTRQALINYAAQRDRLCPNPGSPSFFLSEHGARVTEWALRWTFVKLSRQVGLRGPSDSRGPRLHDLRHRFAVETLVRWYRDGIDVEPICPVWRPTSGMRT